jgi:glycopeptide antibiotics resistance protein
LVVLTPVDPNSAGLFGFFKINGAPERVLNVFLLVPLAFFSKIIWLKVSSKAIFAICLLTSFGIEVGQLGISGRVSDPIDVITNSLGAFLALIYIQRLKRVI